MTNFSDSNNKRSLQKVSLIPPAIIRASSPTSSRPERLQQQQKQKQQRQQQQQQQQTTQNNSENKMNPVSDNNNKVSNQSFGAEVWSSAEDLFWDHMKEVQNKWNTLKLNDDIWAKLIYFEQNRRLAKAYVSAPVLTVDGSINGLDGFRIGLSGIDNTFRSLDSIGCLRSIGQGIKLKIDSHGNILVRKVAQTNSQTTALSQCSVWVKDWPCMTNSKPNGSVENCMMRKIEQSDISYKLFDMRKFRLQLEKCRLNNDNFMDWRQCVSIISFVKTVNSEKQPNNLLENPCWLMIINIIAIDMLKSSICDKKSLNKQGSSSILAQNHSLLEFRNHNLTTPGENTNLSIDNGQSALRASSSASIPFPSAPSSTNSNRANSNSSGTDTANNSLLSNNDRAKKLRTTNSKSKLTPMKSSSYYRWYQSTQQLSSANNTIYTTFDSKFINSKSNTDNSSINDSNNSASRSTSSGQNYQHHNNHIHNHNHQQQQQQQRHPFSRMNPRQQRNSPNHMREDGRIAFARKLLPKTPETTNKSLSLSTLDISQRRLDLRSMQSSIKMNYDYVVETEDSFDQVNEMDRSVVVSNEKLHNDRMYKIGDGNSGREAIKSLNSRMISHPKLVLDIKQDSGYCCEITERLKNSSRKNVNHNKCRAMQGRDDLTDEHEADSTKDHLQKVSRSSIASSSSSSGCADNDYFMSHSSSSMSSSTASNEREVFSQAASSSGIVCSGCTSDEYDDAGRKPQSPPASKSQSNSCSPSPKSGSINSEIAKEHTNASGKKSHILKKSGAGKSYSDRNVKTIEPTECNCCDQAASLDDTAHEHDDARDLDCDCPYATESVYDCFCDCYDSNSTQMFNSSSRCGCEDESIYNRLPPATQVSKVTTVRGDITKTQIKRNSSNAKISSSIKLCHDDFENISTIPNQHEGKESTVKDQKQTSGSWLEKRKYSKILPKFIFSSNRQVNAQRNKSTQRNQTYTSLGREDKFRLSRSTQNLS